MGIKINVAIIKVMRNNDSKKITIMISEGEEQVEKFIYLGSTVTDD